MALSAHRSTVRLPSFREIKELLLNLRNGNRPTELEKSVHFCKERIKSRIRALRLDQRRTHAQITYTTMARGQDPRDGELLGGFTLGRRWQL